MNNSSRISWLAVAMAALLPAVAAAQGQGGAQVEQFVIEIDVFSGRPNPRLVLKDPADVLAFVQKAQEACGQASPVDAARAPEYPAILGYRGISVSRAVNRGAVAHSFVVARGSMRMVKQQSPLACQPRTDWLPADAEGELHLLGAGTGLEAHVAQVALQKGVIDQVLYQVILQQLSAQ